VYPHDRKQVITVRSTEFPGPPSRATLRKLGTSGYTRSLPAGTVLWRIYSQGGYHPSIWQSFRYWGPRAAARFDHHKLGPDRKPCLQTRGILYTARAWQSCVAERFQDTRFIDRRDNDPWLVCFELETPILLLDLHSLWPTRAGTSMAINNGPHTVSRRWSRAIYEAFPTIEGLYYASKMYASAPAVALYERATPALPARPVLHLPLTDPTLDAELLTIAQVLNFTLDPS
jgi:hypothetical protein